MRARASNVMIGTLMLALIAGAFGARLGYQKYTGINQRTPFRVIFEGSASGLRKGGSVNFAGIRIGEVVSLKLDNPRRVVALTMIDNNAPVRKDTQVGLEFQGLTGIAAISFTGGTDDAPPPPLGADGIPELTADPEGTLGLQEKIRVALRNVDKVIADNEVAVKDTLRNFEIVHRIVVRQRRADHQHHQHRRFRRQRHGRRHVQDEAFLRASAATNMAAICCRRSSRCAS